jgi:hypothetical protein
MMCPAIYEIVEVYVRSDDGSYTTLELVDRTIIEAIDFVFDNKMFIPTPRWKIFKKPASISVYGYNKGFLDSEEWVYYSRDRKKQRW